MRRIPRSLHSRGAQTVRLSYVVKNCKSRRVYPESVRRISAYLPPSAKPDSLLLPNFILFCANFRSEHANTGQGGATCRYRPCGSDEALPSNTIPYSVPVEDDTIKSESQIEGSGTPSPPAPQACIELDRYCVGCGYNLRTLPVQRDERTRVLLVRCTECGTYQPANDGATITKPWLHRLTSIVLIGWILFLLALYVQFGFLQGAVMYGTLDELTGYNQSYFNASNPGQITIINGQVVTTRTISASGSRRPVITIRMDDQESVLFLTLMLVISCLLGAIVVGGATVVFPHWRRVSYIALVPIVPFIAGTIVALVWLHEAPHLFDWGVQLTGANAGTHLLGGIAGAFAGRSVVRTIVRVMLPPSVRPRLAFLWLADGKPIPSPRRG